MICFTSEQLRHLFFCCFFAWFVCFRWVKRCWRTNLKTERARVSIFWWNCSEGTIRCALIAFGGGYILTDSIFAYYSFFSFKWNLTYLCAGHFFFFFKNFRLRFFKIRKTDNQIVFAFRLLRDFVHIFWIKFLFWYFFFDRYFKIELSCSDCIWYKCHNDSFQCYSIIIVHYCYRLFIANSKSDGDKLY